jgi:carboxyl-terminal processing protease
MKRIFSLLIPVLLFYCPCTWAQSSSLPSRAIIVKRMIELQHLEPRPVDDSFSVAMFRSMLRTADRRKLLFTDAEYKTFLAFSTKLDDELRGNGWAFLTFLNLSIKNH